MTIQITLNILKQICPQTRDAVLTCYVDPLNQAGQAFDLFQNNKRIAAFLAQIAQESGEFNFIEENLNYTAEALYRTFRKYFTSLDDALPYEHQPEKIANRIYANRMGNGDEASGDGYNYRGRGLIQITGKSNYTRFATAVDMTRDEAVPYMELPEGALASAIWFWDINKLNIYADVGDFVGLTRRINGGLTGIANREEMYKTALTALGQ